MTKQRQVWSRIWALLYGSGIRPSRDILHLSEAQADSYFLQHRQLLPTTSQPEFPDSIPANQRHLSWKCDDCGAVWFMGSLDQKGNNPDCEHDDIQRLSECCGASIDPDIGTCSQCREHA